MLNFNKKIAIFGIGGLARDVFYCLKDIFKANNISIDEQVVFVDKEKTSENYFLNCPLLVQDDFISDDFQVILAIGTPHIRKQIVANLPENTLFPSIIHPTVLMNETAFVGKGVVILPYAVVSCDVKIGDFCIVDRAVQIGHDCKLGNYVHLSPASVMSGNVTLNSGVEVGTSAALKQNIEIAEETVIGMGAIVLKSIAKKGIYVGNPAKKLEK